MKRYALIVAGGKGIRAGSAVPKQFVPVCGKPILMHTLSAFIAYDPSLTLLLTLPQSEIPYWEKLCRDYQFTHPVTVVAGGSTRFESVRNGLLQIKEPGIIAIHDGVRPYVSQALIESTFQTAATHKTAVPVVPVTDSLRMLSTDTDSKVVARNRFVAVQTPQVFHTDLILKAYRQPYRESFTDDASVVEQMGVQITLCEGDPENTKITHPIDLQMAAIRLA